MCSCFDSCYHLHFEDPILLNKSRLAMRLIITELIIYIFFIIGDVFTFGIISIIFSAIILLSIIGCGWSGVTKPNQSALNCYSWCNCLSGSFSIIGLITMLFGFAFINKIRDKCYERTTDGCDYITAANYGILFLIVFLITLPLIFFYFTIFNTTQVLLSDQEYKRQCQVSLQAIQTRPNPIPITYVSQPANYPLPQPQEPRFINPYYPARPNNNYNGRPNIVYLPVNINNIPPPNPQYIPGNNYYGQPLYYNHQPYDNMYPVRPIQQPRVDVVIPEGEQNNLTPRDIIE